MQRQASQARNLADVARRHMAPAKHSRVVQPQSFGERAAPTTRLDDVSNVHGAMWAYPTASRQEECGKNPPRLSAAPYHIGMTANQSIGQRIRTLREQAKVTQSALAAELGVSRSHLTKIELDQDKPGREIILAAAAHFNVSLDWLAEGKGDPRPARATNEQEAMLLFAFRNMPEDERTLHLNLMMKRVGKGDA